MQKKRNNSNRRPRVLHEKNTTKSTSIPSPILEYLDTPSISEIEAPDGFRAVSMSQALMEYAKPVMDFFEKKIVSDMNEAFQVAAIIWNYSIEKERTGREDKQEEVLFAVSKTLKMNKGESIDFLNLMIERKHTLLPFDIQPKYSRIMFIKKEEHFVITEFNYASLCFSETVFPVDFEDIDLIEMINRIDKYIKYNTDYDKWENYYLKMEELCKLRFKSWMLEKGIKKKYYEEFPYCVEIFLNFIYRYDHRDRITLKSMTPIYIEEFFSDHVLRKVVLEPYEYVQFPPAIKTFYMFLSEKEYLNNSGAIIDVLDKIESHFVGILRNRFS